MPHNLAARIAILGAALGGAAIAQEVDLRIAPGDAAQRIRIETRSEITTDRQVRVDGEAMEGRGGPAGPATRTTEITVEFDENNTDDALLRTYRTLLARGSAPDGSPLETEGEIVGKQLVIRSGDVPSVEIDGEALPAMAARRIPGPTSFASLVPSEPVEIGAEFPMGDGVKALLQAVEHPFGTVAGRPDARQRPPGAGREDGPEQGGDQPGRGQQGQRGRDGFARAMASRDPAIGVLSRVTIEPEATGKLVEVDDQGIAKITFQGKMAGEGNPQELGLNPGRMGRRGGGEDAPTPAGDARLNVSFEGVLHVDTRAHRIHDLILDGQMSSHVSTTMNRRGGQAFEVEARSEGSFRIAIAASQAPSEEPSEEPSEAETEKKPD